MNEAVGPRIEKVEKRLLRRSSTKYIKPMRKSTPLERMQGKSDYVPKKYKEMTEQEKKDRVTYLWNKIRLMVSMRGASRELMLEVNQKEREAFGLSDDEEERRLPTE